MTDRFGSYHGIGDEFEGGHQTVDHGRGEYARGDAHVNRVESYSVLHQFGAVHEQAVPQVAACERAGSWRISKTIPMRRDQSARRARRPCKPLETGCGVQGRVFMGYTLMKRSAGFM